ASSGGSLGQIDLSSVTELQEINSDQTITFRVVLFGGTATGNNSGAWYIYDKANNTNSDFYFTGTVEEDDSNSIPGCLEVEYPDNGQVPNYTFEPACSGVPEVITPSNTAYLREYSLVKVTSGTEYIFSLSATNFFITIGNEQGTQALASGYGSVTWTPNFDGLVRFYSHFDENCGADVDFDFNHERRIQCGTPPPALSDCADFRALSNSLEGNHTFAKPVATDIPVGSEAL